MPDLSAYISIAVVLDNSGSSPFIRVIDNSAYPAGIAQQIAGVLSITQPDTITITNNDFTQPDIYWSNGSLFQPARPLRLANNQRFQNGGYLITYTVRCAGYTDTVLAKTFQLNYNPPIPVITPAFDNFTPSLKVTDATVWGMPGYNFIGVTEYWSTVIRSVAGANQTMFGYGSTFDLAYNGSYYDAAYDVTLTAFATWAVADINPFVTVIDKFIPPVQTFTAEIPPSLSQLLTSLTGLKAQLDASLNNGNTYGNSVYGNLLTTYNYAVSLYTHLVDRGQAGSLAGLSAYVYQLQMIFNNGVTPSYVNTNTPIPAYDWNTAGGGGASSWNSISNKPSTIKISWQVGANGYPPAGATILTDNRLAGVVLAQIDMWRGGLYYGTISKVSQASNQLSWPDPLQPQENIVIKISPL